MATRTLWGSRAASYLRISTSYRGFASDLEGGGGNVVMDLRYGGSHQWVKVDGSSAMIGITDHGQDHFGGVMYVKLPKVGDSVTQGDSFGAIESMKATSDVISPVSGKVVEVNEELTGSPGLVNASPYGKGWFIKVEMSEAKEVYSLMDWEKYTDFCEGGDSKHHKSSDVS